MVDRTTDSHFDVCRHLLRRRLVAGNLENTLNKNRELLRQATEIVTEAFHVPRRPPTLGFDLDGTITESPDFFSMLSNVWPGWVYIVSYRSDYDKAKSLVDEFGMKYEELILVDRMDGKAAVIEDREIDIFFDDQPEMLKNIKRNCQVFLVRNGGNFDWRDARWMMSNHTGKII